MSKLVFADLIAIFAFPGLAGGFTIHFLCENFLRIGFVQVIDHPEFRIAFYKRNFATDREQLVALLAGDTVDLEYVLRVRQLDWRVRRINFFHGRFLPQFIS